jgi:hypothetical protein
LTIGRCLPYEALPLDLRAHERRDVQALAIDHEADVAGLQRSPHPLDRVVERRAHQHPLAQWLGLGQSQEDIVDGADGLNYVLGGLTRHRIASAA